MSAIIFKSLGNCAENVNFIVKKQNKIFKEIGPLANIHEGCRADVF
jgi:hypothetical protein